MNKNTKHIMIHAGIVKDNDGMYTYNNNFNEFQAVTPIETYHSNGYALIIHKVAANSQYYVASEMATGYRIPCGSCIEVEGLKPMIDDALQALGDALENLLLTLPISPRYKKKEDE